MPERHTCSTFHRSGYIYRSVLQVCRTNTMLILHLHAAIGHAIWNTCSFSRQLRCSCWLVLHMPWACPSSICPPAMLLMSTIMTITFCTYLMPFFFFFFFITSSTHGTGPHFRAFPDKYMPDGQFLLLHLAFIFISKYHFNTCLLHFIIFATPFSSSVVFVAGPFIEHLHFFFFNGPSSTCFFFNRNFLQTC